MTGDRKNPAPDDGDSRTRLLDAGAELFTKKGFNGCGLSEILKLADVPKGSFYHYFGSKEEFGVVLIDRARDECLAGAAPMLTDRKQDPVDRLRQMFEHIREQCSTSGPTPDCLISKLALETASLSESVHAAVKCAYQQWSALVAKVIREGQAAGSIDGRLDADKLASVLGMLWDGAAIRMQIDRSVQPLDDFLEVAFASLLGKPA